MIRLDGVADTGRNGAGDQLRVRRSGSIGEENFLRFEIRNDAGGGDLLASSPGMRIAQRENLIRILQKRDELIEMLSTERKIGRENRGFDTDLFGVMPVAPDFGIQMRWLR